MFSLPTNRLAMALVICVTCDARAARPLATEDAYVTATGSCELDAYQGRSTQRALPRTNATSVQFGCGLFANSYLGTAYARSGSDSAAPETLVLAGKTALGTAVEGDPAFAVAWGSVGKKVRGTEFRYDGPYATLAASVPIGTRWVVHANLGWSHSRTDHESTTRWDLAVERVLEGGVRASVEAFADDRDTAPWLQAGASLPLVPDRLTANASWGRQVGSARSQLMTAGTTYSF
jgi:hypothetical protein